MFRKEILVLVLLLSGIHVLAQKSDSTHYLPQVEVREYRYMREDRSARNSLLDSSVAATLSAGTLARQLDREAPLFMKSYGPGSVSTLSLRGTGAPHTTLVWNGISINSPMLGLYDFSLLPSWLLGTCTVQQGGNGPLAGSGAMGGAIFLDPAWSTTTGVSVQLLGGTGSFGEVQAGAGLEWSNGKVLTKTRFYSASSDNDFQYTNSFGEQIRQPNAAFHQQGLSHDTRLITKEGHLDFHAWYLENNRDIPPLMVARESGQHQEDRTTRIAAEWLHRVRRWAFVIRGGLSSEYIRFRDDIISLDSRSSSMNLQGDAELSYKAGKNFTLSAMASMTDAEADVDGYGGKAGQRQFSGAVRTVFEKGGFFAQASARKGYFDGNSIPLLPSAGFSWSFARDWQLKGEAARVYRIPTLNDRYWNPGGNPDLLPEEGYTSSLGISWTIKRDGFRISFEPGAFWSELENIIVWMPGDMGYYTALNIHKIRSRGLEGRLGMQWNRKNWKFEGLFTPLYTVSGVVQTVPAFSGAIGKQLIYTPELLYKAKAAVAWKMISLSWYYNYTGFRYTSIDNSQYLEPYQLNEIVAACATTIYGSKLTLSFTVRNLFDEDYQVIAWRAMPGRSFSFGFLLEPVFHRSGRK